LNIILLSDINPLFTSILYKIFILIIPPTVFNGTYSEAGNKAYKTNKGINNKANNKAYKADKGINNKANNKINKAARAIRANKGIIIINSSLSYTAAFYIIFAITSIVIFINISSIKGLGFSLTG